MSDFRLTNILGLAGTNLRDAIALGRYPDPKPRLTDAELDDLKLAEAVCSRILDRLKRTS